MACLWIFWRFFPWTKQAQMPREYWVLFMPPLPCHGGGEEGPASVEEILSSMSRYDPVTDVGALETRREPVRLPRRRSRGLLSTRHKRNRIPLLPRLAAKKAAAPPPKKITAAQLAEQVTALASMLPCGSDKGRKPTGADRDARWKLWRRRLRQGSQQGCRTQVGQISVLPGHAKLGPGSHPCRCSGGGSLVSQRRREAVAPGKQVREEGEKPDQKAAEALHASKVLAYKQPLQTSAFSSRGRSPEGSALLQISHPKSHACPRLPPAVPFPVSRLRCPG